MRPRLRELPPDKDSGKSDNAKAAASSRLTSYYCAGCRELTPVARMTERNDRWYCEKC